MSIKSLPPELKLGILHAVAESEHPIETLLSLSFVSQTFYSLFKATPELLFTAISTEFSIPATWLVALVSVNRATYDPTSRSCRPITGDQVVEIVVRVVAGEFELTKGDLVALRRIEATLEYELGRNTPIAGFFYRIFTKHCLPHWSSKKKTTHELRSALSGLLGTEEGWSISLMDAWIDYLRPAHDEAWVAATRNSVIYRYLPTEIPPEKDRRRPPCWWFTWWLYGEEDEVEVFENFGLPRKRLELSTNPPAGS